MKRIYNIMIMVSILAIALATPAFTVKTASAQAQSGPYYWVSPAQVVVGPDSAVGQNFTVAINLYNVTQANVPNGIQGFEVHLTWNNSLIEPISYFSEVGLSDGVLIGPSILPGISPGFYLDNKTTSPVTSAPYTNATYFNYAAASSSGPWWGNGTIATITFKVDAQPSPVAITTLHLEDLSPDYLVDGLGGSIDHSAIDATLAITSTVTTSTTISFNGTDYPVSIASDSNITMPNNLGFQNLTGGAGASFTFNVTTYDGFCNVTVPYSLMNGNWTVTVDNSTWTSPNMVVTQDSNNYYVWFNFSAGTHQIVLTSSQLLPEFTAATLMVTLMAGTLIVSAAAIGLRKRKFHY